MAKMKPFRLRPAVWATAAAALTLAGPAFAHGGAHLESDPWAAWALTPDIILAALLVGGLYAAGLGGGRGADAAATWRHMSFFAGLAVIFLALQSPVEPLSDHLFLVHQIEHLLLRMAGPMLLALAFPPGPLIRGLPGWGRRYLVQPVAPVARCTASSPFSPIRRRRRGCSSPRSTSGRCRTTTTRRCWRRRCMT